MASFGMLRRVALVRTDVSEELSASFIRLTKIGKVGTKPTHAAKKYQVVTAVKTSNLTYSDNLYNVYT
jgi:DNA-binding TFAR19-related protein (PDSD5 family)